MARVKEFDRDIALEAAIKVFADQGYGGTSTEDLLKAMKIGRQSMYDTFGDKRRLYLEALRHYTAASISNTIRTLNTSASPLKGIEAALMAFAVPLSQGFTPNCLGISAVLEFGRSDDDVTAIADMMGRMQLSAFERLLREAITAGEVPPGLDVPIAAQFLAATLAGLKVSARAGASAEVLRGITRMALQSLQ